MEKFDIVRRKIHTMVGYLDELKDELPAREADYLNAERLRHRGVERLAQLVIECAIDANALLISATGGSPPLTARDSFQAVSDLNAIDESVQQRFQQTFVTFRNILVHAYEKVDNTAVYRTVRLLVDYGQQYIQNLTAYLEQQEQNAVELRKGDK